MWVHFLLIEAHISGRRGGEKSEVLFSFSQITPCKTYQVALRPKHYCTDHCLTHFYSSVRLALVCILHLPEEFEEWHVYAESCDKDCGIFAGAAAV